MNDRTAFNMVSLRSQAVARGGMSGGRGVGLRAIHSSNSIWSELVLERVNRLCFDVYYLGIRPGWVGEVVGVCSAHDSRPEGLQDLAL